MAGRRWRQFKAPCTLPVLAAAAAATVASASAHAIEATSGPGYMVLSGAAYAEHVCHGEDQEFGNCPPLEECKECVPRDCAWSEWHDWYDGGGCVGLRFRHRNIKVLSNECGQPCEGSKTETEEHVKGECLPETLDCVFDVWGDWSTCGSIMDQAVRTRGIKQAPTRHGAECSGTLKETRPCGGPERQDCQLSEWHDWTQCSATCGEGRRARMRRIAVEAFHGGDTCNDRLMEVTPCTIVECATQDCVLSEWSEWSSCHNSAHGQRIRHRSVLKTPRGDGEACDPDLIQTASCLGPAAVDCAVDEWSEWSPCSKSCMGGQSMRERELRTPNTNGGDCPLTMLKVVKSCNEGPCEPEQNDCILSPWTAWSVCSASVGKGATARVRVVLTPATSMGQGCTGPLTEVNECMVHDFDKVDCSYSAWSKWSECTASCGGGTKRRERAIERSAEHGGAQCAADAKIEVAPCGQDSCDPGCIDGVWGDWGNWTGCTATCGTGYRARARTVAVEANHCGKHAHGLREEYAQCEGLPACEEDRDCELSEWNEWTECTASCFGLREHSRHVKALATGNGKRCETMALKVIQPCNPAFGEDPPEKCGVAAPQDCEVGDWQEWSNCTAACGGGQTERKRQVLQASKHGGMPCEDELAVTDSCNTHPCEKVECTDCAWGEWTEWSQCLECGGQRSRHRAVKTLPNHCGKSCDLRSAKEMSNCTSACEHHVFCTWSAWSPADCSGDCGQKTATRTRHLQAWTESKDYLFKAPDASKCQGSQETVVACDEKPACEKVCEPRHCKLAEWSAWSVISCVGLCERQRIITAMNNECGHPCDGNLIETKQCDAMCDESKDCIVSTWAQWSACDAALDGQRFRKREILQAPRIEGMSCPKNLEETRACNVPEPQPCRLDAWSSWTSCSKTCGKGLKMRDRGVLSTAENGGEQCSGSLRELVSCVDEECTVAPKINCALGEWEEWSPCNGDMQRERKRQVIVPASGGGEGCEGSLSDTETCTERVIDCKVSEWTSWDLCSRTCGAGQTRRQRDIMQFPKHGGELCPTNLIETKGCNEGPCAVKDCLVSGWSAWSGCETSCGPGMQSRTREVVRNRGEGGVGCSFELGETRSCPDQPSCGIADCEMEVWSEWGKCSVSCGGGMQIRQRKVKTMPDAGGAPCPAEVLQEVQPCELQECTMACFDGHFGPWSAWAPCSVTCGGGTSFRMREIAKMANECGKEPEGMDREEKFCNVDVPCHAAKDCKFDDWSTWSECSATCNGVKRRERKVKEFGRGAGAFCEGALTQTWPCNPGQGETLAQECLPTPDVDCLMSDWEQWGACSATCGGGEHVRSRSIVQHPLNNGKFCEDSLSELKECARSSCSGPNSVDCTYGEWKEWGECSSCNGERKRHREILTYAAHGGRACAPFDMQEVQQCPRRCGQPMYCGWTSWEDWGACSAVCGTGGKRHRRRSLALSDTPPANVSFAAAASAAMAASAQLGSPQYLVGGASTLQRYEVLYKETKDLEAYHLSEIALSFVCGGGVMLFAMAMGRGVSSFSFGSRSDVARDTYRAFSGPRISERIAQVSVTAEIEDPRDFYLREPSRVPLVASEFTGADEAAE